MRCRPSGLLVQAFGIGQGTAIPKLSRTDRIDSAEGAFQPFGSQGRWRPNMRYRPGPPFLCDKFAAPGAIRSCIIGSVAGNLPGTSVPPKAVAALAVPQLRGRHLCETSIRIVIPSGRSIIRSASGASWRGWLPKVVAAQYRFRLGPPSL